MSPEEFVAEYSDLVERAARKEHKDSRLFTVEDLQQEIWVALLPYTRKLDAQGAGFVYASAVHAAARYAERERNDHQYFQGSFIYTPDLVKAQLELGAWYGEISGDWDLRLDIREVYETLSDRERKLLFAKYMLGLEPGSSTNRSTVSRAIEKMTHRLNGKLNVETLDLELAGTVV